MSLVEIGRSSFISLYVSSFVAILIVLAKSLPSRCADAHSSPSLEESNTTEAKVVKAPPYLAVKTKGDRSME